MLAVKTIFVIVVSTARVMFPGAPPSPEGPTPAAKSITMELFSDKPAPKGAKATVAVPVGLKVGATVSMQFTPGGLSLNDTSPTAGPEVVSKTYWGSSETVPEGQPRIVKSASLSAGPAGYPTKAYALWPAGDAESAKDDSTAPGSYKLMTSYLGTTILKLDYDFLPTVDLVQPTSEVNLAKAVAVEWKPVAGAVGYVVTAYGGTEKESIDWTSSADPAKSEGIDTTPVTADEARKLVENKALLAPDSTKCVIPAGIFAGSDSVVLTVTAVGKDVAQIKNGIDSRVIIRSTLSTPIHTTRMKFE